MSSGLDTCGVLPDRQDVPSPNRAVLGLMACLFCEGSAAVAQTAEGSGSATSGPICTDRPTKANYACTVDAGRFQYESDIVNGSFLRLNGVTTDTYLVVNPTLKYGVTSNIDVEANVSPAEIVRTHDKFGEGRTIAGVSDLYLRCRAAVCRPPSCPMAKRPQRGRVSAVAWSKAD